MAGEQAKKDVGDNSSLPVPGIAVSYAHHYIIKV
jgi:hypothetical protein